MAKDDVFDHVYDNTIWMKNKTNGDMRSGRGKRHCVYVSGLAVFLFLSLLANVVLGCLCQYPPQSNLHNRDFFKAAVTFLHCEPVTNCSDSELEQSNPSCKYKENWKPVNYCPDLPEQWLKGNGSFYVFSSYNRTWSSSRQQCRNMGGELVFINNPEEKEFLAQRLCITGESNFYWTSSSEGNWEGHDSKQVNCAVLKEYTQEDISCQREERSICEIPCH